MKILAACMICLIATIVACRPPGFEIGGGGTVHIPPDQIRLHQTTMLELELRVWGEGTGKMTKRFTDVNCYYRIAGTNDYTKIAMTVKQEDAKKVVFTCVIPPQNERGKKIEYYFGMRFDGTYSRREGGCVPVK
jgi:hypothetical protein